MDPYEFYGPPPLLSRRRGPSGIAIILTMTVLLALAFGALLLLRFRPWEKTGAALPPAGTASQPTVRPIAEWELFEGDRASIWLPDRFRGGHLQRDWPELTRELTQEGSELHGAIQSIFDAAGVIDLLMLDLSEKYIGTSTVVAFGPSLDSLEQTAEAFMSGFQEGVTLANGKATVIEEVEAKLLELPAKRVELTITSLDDGQTARTLLYILDDGDDTWVIGYATSEALYPELEPAFHRSISTFRIRER